MGFCGAKNVSAALTISTMLGTLLPCRPARTERSNGDVAQLGERCLRTAEVGGSNPLVSTMVTPQGNSVWLSWPAVLYTRQ